jgi:hypothetical protein
LGLGIQVNQNVAAYKQVYFGHGRINCQVMATKNDCGAQFGVKNIALFGFLKVFRQ